MIFGPSRSPDALLLWLAGVAASVVRWLEGIAFAIWALDVTGSTTAVGALLAARIAPLAIAGPFAAARVGRRSPKAGLIAGLVGLAAIGGALFWTSGPPSPIAIALYGAASGLFWSAELPLRRAMLARAVQPGEIGAAMSLDAGAVHFTRALGPLLGGALYQLLDIHGVLAFAAIAHLLAAIALSLVSSAPDAPPPPADFGEVRAALDQTPILAAILAVTLALNLFPFAYSALAPALAEARFGLDPWRIGALASLEGAGGFLAALWIGARAKPRDFAKLFFGGAVLFHCAIFVFALAPNLAVAALALLFAGFGLSAFSVMQSAIPLSAAPPGLGARILGWVLFFVGFGLFGLLAIGALGQKTSPGVAIGAFAAIGLACLAAAAWRWPALLRPLEPADPLSIEGKSPKSS